MSNNRVSILSINKLDDQTSYQTQPFSHVQQHQRTERKYQLNNQNQQRFRCKFCHDTFSPETNGRGSCSAAPDKTDTYIDIVTCVCCVGVVVYHCMSDSEDEFNEIRHPCTCNSTDSSNCKKWTLFSILSIFLPCLWFYWPLKACHKIAIVCGCCGGRHKASTSDTVRSII